MSEINKDLKNVDLDRPIEFCVDDELERCKFSQRLGTYILNYLDDECIVIGLSGEWGSGKTSILNMATEQIHNSIKNLDVNEKPYIINFNPWYYSNQNQLINKFFEELSFVLSEDKYLVKKLHRYVNTFITPLSKYNSILRKIKGLFIFIVKKFGYLANFVSPSRSQAVLNYAKYLNERETDLNSLKEELIDGLNGNKLIVIIDDIDRLHYSEIGLIFQLVKLLADFPNTVYLLSYEKKIILKALQNVQGDFEDQYLEKIVQIQIDVPKVSKKDIERLFSNRLDKILEENISDDLFDKVYWGNIYYSGFKDFFRNMRDVIRYTNLLKFNLNLVKDDVNPVDFLVITGIQIRFSDIYYSIRDNKDFFTASSKEMRDEIEENKAFFEEIIKKADKPDRKKLIEILKILFPQINSVFRNISYEGLVSSWRKDLRICSKEKFDTYFELSIRKDELSQFEMKKTIVSAVNMDSFKEDMLSLNEKGKIIEFLELFEDDTDEVDESYIQNIVSVFMDIGDLFPESRTGMGIIDTPMRVLRIIYQLVHRFRDKSKRFSILKEAMENAENSIYIMVDEVSIQDQQHGKYGLGDPSPEENRTLDPDQLEKLETIVIEKINLWAKEGKLENHQNLVQILFDWQRWEPNNTLNFVNDMINTDEGLINFITCFLNESASYTLTDKVSRRKWVMNIKNISAFVDLNEIGIRIRTIISTKDLEDLDEKKKFALNLFLEEIEKAKK